MRLLVVDDEEDFARALARGLRREGYTVDTAFDGLAALDAIAVNDYDLLILDLNLPGMDGLDLCRELRARHPELLIIVLTARDRPDERVTGLDLGADDYLVKPFCFAELCARLRALLRRDMRVRELVLRFADLALDPASTVAWQGKRRLELTRREFSLLHYLMRKQGEVVSQEELLEHVWGEVSDPCTNTVRVHVNSLRRKLGDSGESPRYIQTVIGAGYRLGSPGETEEER